MAKKDKGKLYVLVINEEVKTFTNHVSFEIARKKYGGIGKSFKSAGQAMSWSQSMLKENQNKKQKNNGEGKTIFYAVKKGRNVGVYADIEQAIKQTKGYSGSVMKKFKTQEEAKLFIQEKYPVLMPDELKDIPFVYVDGSYMHHLQIGSYGYVVELNNEIVQKDFGLILDHQMAELGSLGAELQACLRAIEWAIANDYESVRIFYDCEGIIHTIQSSKRKSDGQKRFLELFSRYSNYVRIYFRKVEGNFLVEKHHLAHDLSRTVSGILMQ